MLARRCSVATSSAALPDTTAAPARAAVADRLCDEAEVWGALVVGLARQVDRNDDALAGYEEAMRCHLGDFAEYAALRAQLKERESALSREGAAQRRASAEQSLERLKAPG